MSRRIRIFTTKVCRFIKLCEQWLTPSRIETFGPAFVIIRAKDTDDAVNIANDNDAGLSASVWTRDYKEALEVAKRIESGAVSTRGCTSRPCAHNVYRFTSTDLLSTMNPICRMEA
jgi:hypothetical protein